MLGSWGTVLLFVFASVIGFSLIFENNQAEAFDFPAVYVKNLPNEFDFEKTSREELLGDYEHAIITRENGERIYVYYLYNTKPLMIFYFEDSTDEKVEKYSDFNSDFILLYFKTDSEGTDEKFLYAQRHWPTGCIVPIEYRQAFLVGAYSGCLGGITKTKTTENGWAVYIKSFEEIAAPTKENPFFMKWSYIDFEEVDEDDNEETTTHRWPQNFRLYGTISSLLEEESTFSVNSGKISNNEFLYKPSNILTEGLVSNVFPCAEDTISLSSDQENYNNKDVARFTAKIKSNFFPVTVYLKIYDANDNLVFEKTSNYDGKNVGIFLVDLGKFDLGLYSATARFDINGPTDEVTFRLGSKPIPEDLEEKCNFYSLYDSASKQLSLLFNVGDASHSYLDKIRVFIDRNGNGGKELQADDISFVVDKDRFGGIKVESDGGWLTGDKNEQPANARIKQLFGKYQVLITVHDVSSDFRLGMENTDYNNFEEKRTSFPPNNFATLPHTWSKAMINGTNKVALASDKWIPPEIILKQNLDVNLILVGDTWNFTLQNKIRDLLEKTYAPIIHSELSKAGIKYDYDYNFISLDDQKSQELFDFMKRVAQPVLPFWGEEPFDKPWGIGVWIKNNHTEWINEVQQRYEVKYKLIDAEKMESFLYENVISQDNNLKKPWSTNLVFISGDPNQIDFLHNYNMKRTDRAQNHSHKAVGLMGYGGNYNFYYFDLYAYPWENSQGYASLYDYEMKNHYTNYHDIKTEDRRAELISDYVNNATALIITPSYLYPPVYKSNYILDLLIIGDPGGTASIGTLQDYFINADVIKSEFERLAPFSDWQIKVTVEDRLSRELPKEFKNILKVDQNVPLYDFPGAPIVDIVDSEGVTKIITKWATTRTSSGFKDYQDVEKSSWTIPVVIVIGQRGNPVYLGVGDRFAGGISPSHPDNPTQPCCALGVTYENAVWDDQISVTDLVLHEVGHTMSLMHTFQGYDTEAKPFRNDYFNWYLSPMTYGSPPFSCGSWYRNYMEEGCGIIDTQFTKFEKDHFAKGVAAYLMKAAESNSYRTLVNLEKSGQDPGNPPQDVSNSLEKIETYLDEARTAFLRNDLHSERGAIQQAYAAALESERLGKGYEVSYESKEIPLKTKLQFPEWIKDSVAWWGYGLTTDSDFVNAIQYLIKERIIVIPDLAESGAASGQDIPAWVKNNAIWWAEGVISDTEFVSAIQFLVEQGIIRV